MKGRKKTVVQSVPGNNSRARGRPPGPALRVNKHRRVFLVKPTVTSGAPATDNQPSASTLPRRGRPPNLVVPATKKRGHSAPKRRALDTESHDEEDEQQHTSQQTTMQGNSTALDTQAADVTLDPATKKKVCRALKRLKIDLVESQISPALEQPFSSRGKRLAQKRVSSGMQSSQSNRADAVDSNAEKQQTKPRRSISTSNPAMQVAEVEADPSNVSDSIADAGDDTRKTAAEGSRKPEDEISSRGRSSAKISRGRPRKDDTSSLMLKDASARIMKSAHSRSSTPTASSEVRRRRTLSSSASNLIQKLSALTGDPQESQQGGATHVSNSRNSSPGASGASFRRRNQQNLQVRLQRSSSLDDLLQAVEPPSVPGGSQMKVTCTSKSRESSPAGVADRQQAGDDQHLGSARGIQAAVAPDGDSPVFFLSQGFYGSGKRKREVLEESRPNSQGNNLTLSKRARMLQRLRDSSTKEIPNVLPTVGRVSRGTTSANSSVSSRESSPGTLPKSTGKKAFMKADLVGMEIDEPESEALLQMPKSLKLERGNWPADRDVKRDRKSDGGISGLAEKNMPSQQMLSSKRSRKPNLHKKVLPLRRQDIQLLPKKDTAPAAVEIRRQVLQTEPGLPANLEDAKKVTLPFPRQLSSQDVHPTTEAVVSSSSVSGKSTPVSVSAPVSVAGSQESFSPHTSPAPTSRGTEPKFLTEKTRIYYQQTSPTTYTAMLLGADGMPVHVSASPVARKTAAREGTAQTASSAVNKSKDPKPEETVNSPQASVKETPKPAENEGVTTGLQQSSSGEDLSHKQDSVSTDLGQISVDRLVPKPAKRGPGRPRKERPLVTEVRIKRKPGRPRKIKEPDLTTEGGQGSDQKSLYPQLSSGVVVKRKPGRPRRQPLQPPVKPGRKKRVLLTHSTAAILKIKRKRGRPKKNVEPSGENADVSLGSPDLPGHVGKSLMVDVATGVEQPSECVDIPSPGSDACTQTDYFQKSSSSQVQEIEAQQSTDDSPQNAEAGPSEDLQEGSSVDTVSRTSSRARSDRKAESLSLEKLREIRRLKRKKTRPSRWASGRLPKQSLKAMNKVPRAQTGSTEPTTSIAELDIHLEESSEKLDVGPPAGSLLPAGDGDHTQAGQTSPGPAVRKVKPKGSSIPRELKRLVIDDGRKKVTGRLAKKKFKDLSKRGLLLRSQVKTRPSRVGTQASDEASVKVVGRLKRRKSGRTYSVDPISETKLIFKTGPKSVTSRSDEDMNEPVETVTSANNDHSAHFTQNFGSIKLLTVGQDAQGGAASNVDVDQENWKPEQVGRLPGILTVAHVHRESTPDTGGNSVDRDDSLTALHVDVEDGPPPDITDTEFSSVSPSEELSPPPLIRPEDLFSGEYFVTKSPRQKAGDSSAVSTMSAKPDLEKPVEEAASVVGAADQHTKASAPDLSHSVTNETEGADASQEASTSSSTQYHYVYSSEDIQPKVKRRGRPPKIQKGRKMGPASKTGRAPNIKPGPASSKPGRKRKGFSHGAAAAALALSLSEPRKFALRPKTTRSPIEIIAMRQKQEEEEYDLEEATRLARKLKRRKAHVERLSLLASPSTETEQTPGSCKPCSVVLVDFVKKLQLDALDSSDQYVSDVSYDSAENDDDYDEDFMGIVRQDVAVKGGSAKKAGSALSASPRAAEEPATQNPLTLEVRKSGPDLESLRGKGFVGNFVDFLENREKQPPKLSTTKARWNQRETHRIMSASQVTTSSARSPSSSSEKPDDCQETHPSVNDNISMTTDEPLEKSTVSETVTVNSSKVSEHPPSRTEETGASKSTQPAWNSPYAETTIGSAKPLATGASPGKLKIFPSSDKTVAARYVCKKCDFSSGVKQTMESHVYRHIPGVTFKCGYCSSEFSAMASVQAHVKSGHTGKETRVWISKDINEAALYTVEEPAAEASSTGALQQNADLPDPAAIASQICEAPVVQETQPLIISLVVSGQVRPERFNEPRPLTSARRFVCTHCGYSTNVSEDMKQHVKDLHLESSLYSCYLCDKAFGSCLEEIKAHCTTVHPNRPNSYKKLPDFYDQEHIRGSSTAERPKTEDRGNIFDRMSSLFQAPGPGGEGDDDGQVSPRTHFQRARDYMHILEGMNRKTTVEADSTTVGDIEVAPDDTVEPATSDVDSTIEEQPGVAGVAADPLLGLGEGDESARTNEDEPTSSIQVCGHTVSPDTPSEVRAESTATAHVGKQADTVAPLAGLQARTLAQLPKNLLMCSVSSENKDSRTSDSHISATERGTSGGQLSADSDRTVQQASLDGQDAVDKVKRTDCTRDTEPARSDGPALRGVCPSSVPLHGRDSPSLAAAEEKHAEGSTAEASAGDNQNDSATAVGESSTLDRNGNKTTAGEHSASGAMECQYSETVINPDVNKEQEGIKQPPRAGKPDPVASHGDTSLFLLEGEGRQRRTGLRDGSNSHPTSAGLSPTLTKSCDAEADDDDDGEGDILVIELDDEDAADHDGSPIATEEDSGEEPMAVEVTDAEKADAPSAIVEEDNSMGFQILEVVSLRDKTDFHGIRPSPESGQDTGSREPSPAKKAATPVSTPTCANAESVSSGSKSPSSTHSLPEVDADDIAARNERLVCTYKCHKCNVHSPALSAIVEHLKQYHRDVPLFSCPYCKVKRGSFFSEEEVHMHVKEKHPSNYAKNEVSLSEVAKSFVQVLAIPSGRNSGGGLTEQDVYMCLKCENHVPDLDYAFKHLQLEHPGLIKYACPTCKTFRDGCQKVVQKHMLDEHRQTADCRQLSLAIEDNFFTRVTSISVGGVYCDHAPVPPCKAKGTASHSPSPAAQSSAASAHATSTAVSTSPTRETGGESASSCSIAVHSTSAGIISVQALPGAGDNTTLVTSSAPPLALMQLSPGIFLAPVPQQSPHGVPLPMGAQPVGIPVNIGVPASYSPHTKAQSRKTVFRPVLPNPHRPEADVVAGLQAAELAAAGASKSWMSGLTVKEILDRYRKGGEVPPVSQPGDASGEGLSADRPANASSAELVVPATTPLSVVTSAPGDQAVVSDVSPRQMFPMTDRLDRLGHGRSERSHRSISPSTSQHSHTPTASIAATPTAVSVSRPVLNVPSLSSLRSLASSRQATPHSVHTGTTVNTLPTEALSPRPIMSAQARPPGGHVVETPGRVRQAAHRDKSPSSPIDVEDPDAYKIFNLKPRSSPVKQPSAASPSVVQNPVLARPVSPSTPSHVLSPASVAPVPMASSALFPQQFPIQQFPQVQPGVDMAALRQAGMALITQPQHLLMAAQFVPTMAFMPQMQVISGLGQVPAAHQQPSTTTQQMSANLAPPRLEQQVVAAQQVAARLVSQCSNTPAPTALATSEISASLQPPTGPSRARGRPRLSRSPPPQSPVPPQRFPTQPLPTQMPVQPLPTQMPVQPLPTQMPVQPPPTQMPVQPLPTQMLVQLPPTQMPVQPPPTQMPTHPANQRSPVAPSPPQQQQQGYRAPSPAVTSRPPRQTTSHMCQCPYCPRVLKPWEVSSHIRLTHPGEKVVYNRV